MSEEARIEEIRKRAEGFTEGKLGQPLTPRESLEKGMDFAYLTTEDIPYLLKRVEELETLLRRARPHIGDEYQRDWPEDAEFDEMLEKIDEVLR